MSTMYKTIFVTEDTDYTGENVISINGEVYMFGETAFSSLDEAVASVTSNAVVLKVASGKYESYVVYNNGTAGTEVAISEVVAVDFGGVELSDGTTVSPAAFTTEDQVSVMKGLNSANSGTVYVAADENINADSKVYVTSGAANYQSVGDATVVSGSTIDDIFTLITGKNPDVQIEVSNDSENEVVSEAKTIFVNAEYTDDQIDEAHFNSFEDALAAACQDASIGRIEVESNISEQAKNVEDYYYISQDLVIGSKAGEKYTVNLGVAICNKAGNSITFEENVIVSGLDVVANGFATSGENMYINGEMNALSLKQWTSNGEIVVSETGKVALGYGDGQFDMAYGNGSVTVNGTIKEGTDWSTLTKNDAQFKAGYSGTRGNGNTLNLNDTYFEAGRDFTFNGTNGTINADNSLFKISGGDFAGKLNINNTGNVVNLKNGSLLDTVNVNLAAGNTINVEDSEIKVSTLTNNGTITVSGESTLNIGTYTSEEQIEVLHNTTIKDSTVGGHLLVLGDVTFKGKNTFAMIDDYGDAYSDEAAHWTIEKGASVILTEKARYGLGYGDSVTINGNITDARTARESLTEDDLSFFTHGLVGMSSWDVENSFTVNDAYVVIGENNSFGNTSKSGYKGTYTFSFDNSVLDSSRITFYEAASKTTFTFKDSDVNVGTFMTRDSDSVFTLDNTKLVSTTATNGTDEGNYNAGTLNINNGSDITYTAELKNEGGTINVTGSAFTAGTVTNDGTIEITDATFKADKVDNESIFLISGTSTVQIDDATGSGYSYRAADGATLNNSYIKTNDNSTLRMLGSLTVNGGLSVGYLQGASAAKNGVGGTLKINDNGVINASYGVEFSNDYVLSGGKIVLSGGNASGALWGFVFQNGTFDIDTDIEVDGLTGESAVYAPIHFTNVNATVRSDITHKNSGGEVIYISESSVEMVDGSTWTANAGVHVNDTSSLSVVDSSIVAGAVVVASTASLSLTVTDKKLASLGKDAYYMINQTGNGAALDLGVTYNGEVYKVGQSITVEGSDIVYNVIAGDGNDIAIQAAAKTVTLDASATENRFTVFNKADTFFEKHASYETRMQGAPEEIKVVGTNTLESTASEYYVYTDSDLSITGGTLDVSNAGRFYFMDTVAPNGTAIKNADFSDVATVTIEEGATLKGYINLGQAIDNSDVDSDGNATRDGGAMNMIVKGTLDHKNIYVNSGSTLTVTETGKVTNYKDGGDNHIRANAKVVVNGTGKDSDVQFKTNWWSIRGGEMEFNNTNAETGTLRLNADTDNAIVTGDTEAVLKVNNSKLTAYTIEVNNADSSFSAIDSDVKVTALLQNYGTTNISGSTVEAGKVQNYGAFAVTGDSTIKVDKFTSTSGKAVTFGGAEDRSELTIGSVSGNGAAINVDRLNIYKSDVTLTDNVTVGAPTGAGETYGLHKIQDSTIDLNGNTMTYKGFTVLDSYEGVSQLGSNQGVTIKNGEFKVTDSGHLCFQGYDHVIAEDAVVNFDGSNYKVFKKYDKEGNPEYNTSTMVNVYGSLTVKGKLNVTHNTETNHGYDNVGTTDTGWDKASYPESVLTVSGANAEYIIENGHMFNVIHETDSTGAGTMNIVNGATFSFTGADGRSDVGLFFNSNIVNVDAQSSFTVGNYRGYDQSKTVKGSFNSTKAGEMIVLGEVNVLYNLATDDLILKAGAALSAGSITVNNLTLAIGSELTLGSGNSTIAADYITVTGELVPANAEYTLVASGWTEALAGKQVWFDANYNGTIEDSEKFTVQTDTATLSGLNFVFDGGKLYVKDFGAAISGIYIGELPEGAQDGDKFSTPDGATYTVGKDAFSTAADAATALNGNVGDIESIALGNGDHVNEVANNFGHVSDIIIQEGVRIEDSDVAEFDNDLNIQNDGHLDTHIKAGDKMNITNTSVNTLLGSYETDSSIGIENLGGKIGDANGAETVFTTNYLEVHDGDAENVKANVGTLELVDTDSFGLNADSGVITNDGEIFLNGSANMSIDGDITETNAAITADDNYAEHTGTLTLNGNQTFNSNISANKIVIADEKTVEINGTADFKELAVEGTIKTDFTSMNSYSDGGKVTGEGKLNSTHEGEWVINDTVKRDFSGFEGTVSMTDANASIVMGKGDFPAVDVEKSYFSDDAKVVVNGTQSVVLAGDGVNTAIDFSGNGVLNVGNYENGFKDQSEDFKQTLSGDNSNFTGTVNVSEGAQLTVENALGATAINLNAEAVQSAENTADALLDTQLILNKDGLDIKAAITGDKDDIISVNQNATLSKTGALNNFAGTVDVEDGKTVSLNAENNTAAEFVGGETAVINVNANTTLTADNTDFIGTVNIGANSKLTLSGDLSSDEKGAIKFTTKTSKLDLVADEANEVITIGGKLDNTAVTSGFLQGNMVTVKSDAEFTAEGALDNFTSTIDIQADNTLTLSGNNNTQTNLKGSGTLELADEANAIELTLRNERIASGSLTGNSIMNFSGTFALNDNALTIQTYSQTNAVITGDANAKLNIEEFYVAATDKTYVASLTLNTAEALNGFNGSINLTNGELNVKKNNTTSATITGDSKSVLNISDVLTLNKTDAISDFEGTINTYNADDVLTLKGENTTAATLKGNGVIDADANQTFTGNVSAFTGTYDIASDKTVTMSATSTIADTINAKGGTLTLENTAVKDVTVNSGTGNSLTNLNFGGNDLTLGTGDFTNVIGTGDIEAFGADKEFSTVKAENIYVAGDNLTITEALQAVINLTINGNSDTTADVNFSGAGAWDDSIKVVIASDFSGAYKLVSSANGYTITQINLVIGSENADIKIGDAAQIGGHTYRLINDNNTLVLDKMSLYSNFVVINSAWAGQPYNQINDNGTTRNIGYDAANSLDTAVAYIKGYDKGTGWIENGNAVTVTGGAKIELTEGKYTLSADKYLMNADNEVTNLTLAARDGATASLSGVVRGADGSADTTLTVNNVHFLDDIFAGGKLVVDNSGTSKSVGTVVAGGVDKGSSIGSSVTVKGGTFAGRYVVGGSYNETENTTIAVNGNTSVTVSSADAEVMIYGNVYGGSYARRGSITQTGDAIVNINIKDNSLAIRRDIYVSGSNVTLDGNSYITFSGDADLLSFSGSVNAIQSAKDEIAYFDNFKGTFNGYFDGFDSITIEGSTKLDLGRRQTKTANTEVSFVVNADSKKNTAMYLVRDANRWEFAKVINIDVDNAKEGSYVLVDNYNAGFESGFTFTFGDNDAAYTLGTAITVSDKQYTVTSQGDSLVLDVVQVYSGVVNDNVSGTSVLENATVSGNVAGTFSTALNTEIGGNTVINGRVISNAKNDSIEIAEGASVTIKGTASDNFGFFTSGGNDTVNVADDASVVVEGGHINLGAGDDTMVIGENVNVVISAANAKLQGGAGNDNLIVGKGSSITSSKVEDINITMDVDAVLNNTCAPNLNSVNNVKLNVVGVKDLVLHGTNAAGAKSIFANLGSSGHTLKVDGVDMILDASYDAGTKTAGAETPDQRDDLWTNIGEVKQIAGADTTADTSDDVWASLNKIDNNLVVAWGSTKEEAGAALDAFNHYKNNNTDLVLGDAVVSSELADGFNTTDTLEKKSNGTLA